MRLHQLKLRGVSTAFRHSTVTLDFDAMPEGLVALVGDNGAGKTTVLEASGPLVLYRGSPSYGETFAERIVPGVRDAIVALDFSLGSDRYRAIVRADPMAAGGRGKTEATLSIEGQICAGPLVREYDAAIATILPPEDVFLASAFAAQGGRGSFFTMKPAERREVLAVLLGLGRLQRCAEAADERRSTVVVDLALAEQAVAAGEAAWEEAESLREDVDEAGGTVTDTLRTRDRLGELAREAAGIAEQEAGKLAAFFLQMSPAFSPRQNAL